MKLFPAIDLLDGNCVRLFKGDYNRSTVYEADPAKQAARFVADGAQMLHLVDLNAAKGEPQNLQAIASVAEALRSSDVLFQVGGGVRDIESATRLYDLGVDRVVIGTAAVENPTLVSVLVENKHQVVVGLDGRAGKVATQGWKEQTNVTIVELAKQFSSLGVSAIAVTDIERDGTLQGPDVSGLEQLLAQVSVPLIASGGVSSLRDLRSLAKLKVGDARLDGVIVGRALYESKFTLAQAAATIESESA